MYTTLFDHPVIAVDLGTANTRIYSQASKTFSEQPSSLSMVDALPSAGTDEYLLHTNQQLKVRPLRGGVVVDIKNAVSLLKPLIRQARPGFLRPISLVSAPSDASRLERSRLKQVLIQAGAQEVCVIPEIWAAALGAGIDIERDSAQLLVDIGDGVTDIAVFRCGRIEAATSIRLACSDLQRVVRSQLLASQRVRIPISEAERLTNCLDALLPEQDESLASIEISALDIALRRQRTCRVGRKNLALAMEPVFNKIAETIRSGLQRLPAEWYDEIGEVGFCITGGGACIRGMSSLLAARTGMPVQLAMDPLHTVINGAKLTLQLRQGEKEWWNHLGWASVFRLNAKHFG